MKKNLFLFLIFTQLPICSLFAQVDLIFNYACKPKLGLFSKVNIIDKRVENQSLGFIQNGAFNSVNEIIFLGNLKDSLAKFFLTENDSTTTNSELTILLLDLNLSEQTYSFSEKGRLKLAMRLFTSSNNVYFKEILNIDSVYFVKAGDVTKRLLNSVSVQLFNISKLAEGNKFNYLPNSPNYTLQELNAIDSIEKLKIPIYNTNKVKPGIYLNYKNFSANEPDSSIIEIAIKNERKIVVFSLDKESNQRTIIDNKNVYAVSDGTTVLKATQIGFYKLEKKENDFYYIGQTSATNYQSPNVGAAAVAGMAFGLAGAIIANSVAIQNSNKPLHYFKLNYLKGNSVPIYKLK